MDEPREDVGNSRGGREGRRVPLLVWIAIALVGGWLAYMAIGTWRHAAAEESPTLEHTSPTPARSPVT